METQIAHQLLCDERKRVIGPIAATRPSATVISTPGIKRRCTAGWVNDLRQVSIDRGKIVAGVFQLTENPLDCRPFVGRERLRTRCCSVARRANLAPQQIGQCSRLQRVGTSHGVGARSGGHAWRVPGRDEPSVDVGAGAHRRRVRDRYPGRDSRYETPAAATTRAGRETDARVSRPGFRTDPTACPTTSRVTGS